MELQQNAKTKTNKQTNKQTKHKTKQNKTNKQKTKQKKTPQNKTKQQQQQQTSRNYAKQDISCVSMWTWGSQMPKIKSRFVTCPCHKIYMVEAVGLSHSKCF